MSWLDAASIRYASLADVKQYQKAIKARGLQDAEQKWVNRYLQPLFDFMGSRAWDVVSCEIRGAGGRASTRSVKLPYPRAIAVYSGAHWRSAKAGDLTWFDPYDAYQVPGTNQFCQTFAMMYITDHLPQLGSGSWDDYYTYTCAALKFIGKVLNLFNSDPEIRDLKVCLAECKRHSNACLNVIEFP